MIKKLKKYYTIIGYLLYQKLFKLNLLINIITIYLFLILELRKQKSLLAKLSIGKALKRILKRMLQAIPFFYF